MKRKQFTEEQFIGILKEAEAGSMVTEPCRKHGMSSATYYAWEAKCGGLGGVRGGAAAGAGRRERHAGQMMAAEVLQGTYASAAGSSSTTKPGRVSETGRRGTC